MRLLTLHPGPNFSVADVYNGWTKALKNLGVQVVGFPYDLRLNLYKVARVPVADDATETRPAFDDEGAKHLAAKALFACCYEYLPDAVVVVSGMFVPNWALDVIRARGTAVVGLLTEQPYELARELEMAEHCDLVILNDPANLARFEQITDAYYQPHSHDPDLHHPGPGRADLACDVSFCGTAYPSRLAFLDDVDWPTDDVRLAGNWKHLPEGHPFERWLVYPDRKHCMTNDETADLYRSSRASFNLYRADDETGPFGGGSGGAGWAMGPREVELAACGTWFARHARPEGDEVLSMLPAFTDPAGLSDALRWALTHDDARQAAANAARAAVADRTFENAARRFLPRLERLLAA